MDAIDRIAVKELLDYYQGIIDDLNKYASKAKNDNERRHFEKHIEQCEDKMNKLCAWVMTYVYDRGLADE